MGSGHFLIAAVDRIERCFTRYLADRSLPMVRAELQRLREAAQKALGRSGEAEAIEDSQLLRRQIARRCIYGVDINPVAFQLARVAVWIHTFVPGLPLSFLEHNLVEGNSVVGIATIEEARAELKQHAGELFTTDAEELLGAAEEPLSDLSRLTDADAREIAKAREARERAEEAVEPTETLFDIIAAARLSADLEAKIGVGRGAGNQFTKWTSDPDSILGADELVEARSILAAVDSFHFPIAFPEVFLPSRGGGGFDCILGNPPWEEVTIEEDRFWTRYFPGLHSLSENRKHKEITHLEEQRPDLVREFGEAQKRIERQREALVSGPFPGIGEGDPDLYKAFAWRFLNLLQSGGTMGVVLPRSALAAKGSAAFRTQLLKDGTVLDLTLLQNRNHWVFDDQHPQYTIALLSASADESPDSRLPMHGPFNSRQAFTDGREHAPVVFRSQKLSRIIHQS